MDPLDALLTEVRHYAARGLYCCSLAAGAVLLPTVPAGAAGAHVHGEAELQVSVGEDGLLVALRGPAQLFFGFEHAPDDAREKAAVADALAVLRDSGRIFAVAGARCVVGTTDIDSPFHEEAETASETEGSDHAHGESQRVAREALTRGDHHGPVEPGAGEAADAPGGRGQAAHTDLRVEYTLACGDDSPRSLRITAFDAFPGLHKLHVAWVTQEGSGSDTLDAAAPVLALTVR